MKPLYPTIVQYLEEQPLLSGLDKRLLQLFTVYDKDISEWLELSRPEKCYGGENWTGSDIEFIGPTFHKLFRQIDVLPTAQEDMDVWKALNEHSEFWPALEMALVVSSASSMLEALND